MAKPVTLGDREFSTRDEATEFIKGILYDYEFDEVIEEPNHSYLLHLLARHPRANEKIGPLGVAHFKVQPGRYGTRCFKLYRPDGTDTDFSYPKCISAKESRSSLAYGAMREATSYHCAQFREQEFKSGDVFCPYLKVKLGNNNFHVDHTAPKDFYTLVSQWLTTMSLTIEEVVITESMDNVMGREMADPAQKALWVEYHALHADLRIISKLANLSHAKVEANKARREAMLAAQ